MFAALAEGLSGLPAVDAGPKSAALVAAPAPVPQVVLVMPSRRKSYVGVWALLAAVLLAAGFYMFFWRSAPTPYEPHTLPGPSNAFARTVAPAVASTVAPHVPLVQAVAPVLQAPQVPQVPQVPKVPPQASAAKPSAIIEDDIVDVDGPIPLWDADEADVNEERPMAEDDPRILQRVKEREAFTKHLEASIAAAIKTSGSTEA